MQPAARDTISGDRPNRVTGRTVLLCLVAFFTVVTGVNAVMIFAAVTTFGGAETRSAYQAGLAFSRETAAARTQDDLKWQVKAAVRRSAIGATLVEVVAQDEGGRPLAGLEATASLLHPTDRRADHVVPLDQGAAGSFRGTTDAVVGQWDLVVELSRDGTRMFRSKNRIMLR